MGQFEKIVVLTVLSLIAVILVISFSTDEDDPLAGIAGSGERTELALAETGAQPETPPVPRVLPGRQRTPSAPAPEDLDIRDPFDGDVADASDLRWPDELELAPEVETPDPAPRIEPEPAPPSDGRPPLLSSTIDRREETAPARDPRLPASSALLTLRDLEDSFDPELKLYTWRRGDSFEALARRFYGDASYATLLRRHNEDRESVPAGEAILVPVHDRRDAPPERVSAGRTHLVQEGESLWSIATKAYGRGNDWQRIFEANRDRLTSPDAVRAGMELRLP